MAKENKKLAISEDNGKTKNLQIKRDDIATLYGVHSALSLVGVTSVEDRDAIIANLRVLKRISTELDDSYKAMKEALQEKGYPELLAKYKEDKDSLSSAEMKKLSDMDSKYQITLDEQAKVFNEQFENVTLVTISKKSFNTLTGNQSNEKVNPMGFVIFEDFVVKEEENKEV